MQSRGGLKHHRLILYEVCCHSRYSIEGFCWLIEDVTQDIALLWGSMGTNLRLTTQPHYCRRGQKRVITDIDSWQSRGRERILDSSSRVETITEWNFVRDGTTSSGDSWQSGPHDLSYYPSRRCRRNCAYPRNRRFPNVDCRLLFSEICYLAEFIVVQSFICPRRKPLKAEKRVLRSIRAAVDIPVTLLWSLQRRS